MSYILDALRRAESERGRGAVPGLHTPAAAGAGGALAAGRSVPATPWAVAALTLAVAALAVGGTWWFLQRQAPAGERVVVAAVPAAAVAPPAAPPVPAASAAPVAPAAPRPVADHKRPAPPPRERPAVAPAPRASAAEPAATAAAPASPVFAQGDLPDAVRAQLPTLKVTGATYSNNPAYRMAIVNGQVLHEGEAAAPGLLLERIEPGRTVWSFRGYRYAVASQ